MQQKQTDQRPYTRSEIHADAAVHGLGVAAGAIASAILIVHTVRSEHNWPVVAIYLAALLAMLGFSASYNLWPPTPLKEWLRRFDHSAIYLLIAGTYTPLLPFLVSCTEAMILGGSIWTGAAIGVSIKFLLPGRFDGAAIAVYLGLGWAGVLSSRSFYAVLPGSTMALIAIGGIFYTAGVIFHIWQRLKFHNAIWHGLVAMAAACHFAAIALAYA